MSFFPVFQVTLIRFFLFQLSENFFSTVSKCAIKIMIIMMINVNIFAGFQLIVIENTRTFAKKIYTAHNHSDARQSETLFMRSI